LPLQPPERREPLARLLERDDRDGDVRLRHGIRIDLVTLVDVFLVGGGIGALNVLRALCAVLKDLVRLGRRGDVLGVLVHVGVGGGNPGERRIIN
jgi:hypothetical protein